ncbi:hypothetical protein [Mycolicibacterium phlei]|uniref:hypothetical protein n=1 Tax=Mycolicibacterium phlei TaxID=1771 RepID=UPI00025AE727|nr:hypothetical protein [Mycolicibacterium phlei]EID10209.1 hypothetical protein MPHLEI_22474 [Mycolicibacterium phlei RIVM601174]MBF4194552.1 hypothetical protein [Mycolicibacterium phlei]
MPRKDKNGRGLQGVLSYLLDRAVPATEIYGALGIARNTYHKRIEEDSYPNAEECRLVAERFGINPVTLLVHFGLVTYEDVERCLQPPLEAKSTTTKPTKKKAPASTQTVDDLVRRTDVPPL